MHLLDHAKTLRTRQTDAEQRLWYHLRAHRFMNLKFRRQKPIGRYIVDFVCHESWLIVEVDGGQHQEKVAYDRARDLWLQEQGYNVLRFWNHEVMQQIEEVLESIRQTVQRTLSPGPSPASGRGENGG
jgi:very-short-patch-repair endonuclease